MDAENENANGKIKKLKRLRKSNKVAATATFNGDLDDNL